MTDATNDAINIIADEIDEVQSGQNQADEFALTPEQENAIKDIFTQFDKDKNGTIEKKELNTLCAALNDPLSPAELQDFFTKVDKDNSGRITWDEFIGYWRSN
jgi:Ca2+-binding EF-hand superfamily protein